MVAPEWVVQHPTLPESKMLSVAPMGSLDMLFTPTPLTAQPHDQSPWQSSSARKIGYLCRPQTLRCAIRSGSFLPADKGVDSKASVLAATPCFPCRGYR